MRKTVYECDFCRGIVEPSEAYSVQWLPIKFFSSVGAMNDHICKRCVSEIILAKRRLDENEADKERSE